MNTILCFGLLICLALTTAYPAAESSALALSPEAPVAVSPVVPEEESLQPEESHYGYGGWGRGGGGWGHGGGGWGHGGRGWGHGGRGWGHGGGWGNGGGWGSGGGYGYGGGWGRGGGWGYGR